MVHGLNRSRIEMVRRAPFVHQAGWNALLVDLRHHGASGGETTTFGVKEKEDVEAAVRLARERSPGPVVVWGVSLGAASVVFAAAGDPEVRGVICDSSFRSLDDTVRHHLQLFRGFRWWLRIVPNWPVADLAIFWMGQRGGFDTRRRGRAGRRGPPEGATRPLRGELRRPAHAEGDRVRPAGGRGPRRRGADRAREEPRRRVARRDRSLRGGRRGAAREGAARRGDSRRVPPGAKSLAAR